jgi:hypothetical protein
MGVPARIGGWVCACGESLADGSALPERVTCPSCARSYRALTTGGLELVEQA